MKNKETIKLIFFTSISLIIYFFNFSSFEVNKNEKYYQMKICDKLNGQQEYLLNDRSRVDCLTKNYAIEVEWAKKWAEGIGQSLYYAKMTNKEPAIALIIGNNDEKYLKRLKLISDELNIKIIKLDK
jgi:hypothetical protein